MADNYKLLMNDTARKTKRIIQDPIKALIAHLQESPEFADVSPDYIERLLYWFEDRLRMFQPVIDKFIGDRLHESYRRGIVSVSKANNTPPHMLMSDNDKVKELQTVWINNFKGLNDELKLEVRNVVSNTLRSGSDPKQVIPQLRNILKAHDKGKESELNPRGMRLEQKATIMGRTLIVEGFNVAKMQRDQQSGIVWGGEWTAANDERTCPLCGALDGTTVKMGENFEIKYKGVNYSKPHPPLHFQCRCTRKSITFIEAKRRGLWKD